VTPAARSLVRALTDPTGGAPATLRQWEALLSGARRNGVLGYLAFAFRRAGRLDAVPDPVRVHFDSAEIAHRRTAQLARWELDRIRFALAGEPVPLIALKGAGYLLRGLAHAGTRLMADVDLLVRREDLDRVEQALLAHGWVGETLDAYDQRYYRRWMHELPPLKVPGRLLGVDLHHTIAPPVSRLHPDPSLFWNASVETSFRGYRVLSPADTFLHSAVHLFFDSDFNGRLRELVDLHELAGDFGAEPGFWDALVERARVQGLGRPLYYAAQTLTRILATPLPRTLLVDTQRHAPVPPVRAAMLGMLERVLSPIDPEDWPRPHGLALWLLYVRSHWLRMPPHLLVPHLVRKAVRPAAQIG
jgi:hypothetical protein